MEDPCYHHGWPEPCIYLRIWPYVRWNPCQKCCVYTAHVWFWPTLVIYDVMVIDVAFDCRWRAAGPSRNGSTLMQNLACPLTPHAPCHGSPFMRNLARPLTSHAPCHGSTFMRNLACPLTPPCVCWHCQSTSVATNNINQHLWQQSTSTDRLWQQSTLVNSTWCWLVGLLAAF